MDKKNRILLVDDEQDILEFISYNLEKEGYEIATASNGFDAIEKALEFKPDLIILDIMMPKIDGIETCYKLRALEDLPKNVVIAFLTARGEDYTQVAALESGADDFIIKPIKPRVLVSKVQSLLRRSSSVVEETEENSSNLIIDKERYLVIKDGEKITLIGFSQGAILSYGVALSKPEKIKNIIALSGYVSEPILQEEFEQNDFSNLGIFASHGTVDQVIPIEWARKSDSFLTQLDLAHTYKEYPIGHGISPQVFFDFKNWLEAQS